MKRFIVFIAILSVALVISCVPASAGKQGDWSYETLSDGTIAVTKYSGNAKQVTVPGTIDEKQVTKIGESCFAGNKTMTDVTVPVSVNQIDIGAFRQCSNLTTVSGLEGVTNIASDCFSDCTSLVTVGDLKHITEIGSSAFSYCKNLESIHIPESCIRIYDYAFVHCERLDGIEIPESMTEIRDGAFAYSGIRWAKFRGETTRLSPKVFIGCEKLTDVTLPNRMTSLNDGLFYGCKSLKTITIPAGVKRIGTEAFSASGIKTVVFPDALTVIGDSAFAGCNDLTHIVVGDNVEQICPTAFWNCSNLETIHIGKQVKEIDFPTDFPNLGGIFAGCPKLTAIDVDEDNESFSSVDGVLMNKTQTEILALPNGKTAYYIVPKSVKIIGERAFAGCSTLRGIELRSSVKTIKDPAAFTYFNYGEDVKVLPLVVRKGSYAEAYAKQNQLSYTVAASIRSVTADTAAARVEWDCFDHADRYQLRYSLYEDMSHSQKLKLSSQTTSVTLSDLIAGETYYFQLRSIVRDSGTGKSYKTVWSAKEKCTIL